MDEEECEECEEGAPAWMATFSDLCTLLLTFFILLLSFAHMDVQFFQETMGSIRVAFGVQQQMPGVYRARSNSPVEISPGGSPYNPNILPQAPQMQPPSSQAHHSGFQTAGTSESGEESERDQAQSNETEIRERLEEEGLSGTIEVEQTDRGIALRVDDEVLFRSGSADLRSEGLPTLRTVAELAVQMGQALAIEGHTDNRPISTTRFPSNWELSAARAASVLRFIGEEGIPQETMSIAGYADTRPLADNDTPEGRSRNRRVEFVFLGPAPANTQGNQDAQSMLNSEATESPAEQASDSNAASPDAPPPRPGSREWVEQRRRNQNAAPTPPPVPEADTPATEATPPRPGSREWIEERRRNQPQDESAPETAPEAANEETPPRPGSRAWIEQRRREQEAQEEASAANQLNSPEAPVPSQAREESSGRIRPGSRAWLEAQRAANGD